jgi:hypothetical protein
LSAKKSLALVSGEEWSMMGRRVKMGRDLRRYGVMRNISKTYKRSYINILLTFLKFRHKIHP